MAENILLLVFSIPAIFGLAEILHILKLQILKPQKSACRVLVIRPDTESFVTQLLYVAERFRWQGLGYADKIVVLDSELCGVAKDECGQLASSLGFMSADGKDLLESFFEREEDGVASAKF